MTTRRPRRWRRWLWRLLLGAVAARLLLAIFLVPLLTFAASFFELRLSLRSASLSLSGLSLRLDDVVALDAGRPTAAPLLVAQEVVFDLSSWVLLRGEVGIVDAAVSGARITVRRLADGSLQLPASWSGGAPVATVPAPAPAPEPGPPGFALPLRIASARLHDCRLVVVDDAAPAETIDITLDVEASEIGRFDVPGTLVVRAHSPRWLDRFTLQAQLLATPDRLTATWEGQVRGVPPGSLPLPRDLAATLQDTRLLALTLAGEVHGEVPTGSARHRLSGKLQLDVTGDQQDLLHLAANVGPVSRPGDDAGLPFDLEFAARGVVASLRVANGVVRQHAGSTSVGATLAVEKAQLAWLRRLLATQGITPPASGMQLRSAVEAEFGDGMSFALRDLVLRGDDDEAKLRRLEVRDLRSVAGGGVAIDAIEVDGPEVALRREADGTIVLAGVRFGPAPDPAAPAPDAPTPAGLPQLRLGSLRWQGAAFTLVDASLAPPATLRVDGLQLAGDALTLGADAPPGRLSLSARVVDAIDSVRLDATLTPGAKSADARIQVAATGITGTSATPWLQRLGITPALQSGTLQLQAGARVVADATGLRVDAEATDVVLRDGDTTWMSLGSVRGEGLRPGGAPDLGSWRVQAPLVTLRRHGDGTVQAFGMRFTAAPAAAMPRAAEATAARGDAAAAPTPLQFGPLTLGDGTLRLLGDGPDPTDLTLRASVGRIAAGAAFPFELRVQLDAGNTEASIGGEAAIGAASRVDAQVAAHGLRGAALQRWLPGLRSELQDGRLQVQIAAEQRHPAGGLSLRLERLTLHDGDQELAALGRLLVRIDDSSDDHLHVGELDVRGLRGALTLADDGLHVAGLVLPPAGSDAPTPPPAPVGPTAVRLPLLQVDAFAIACERLAVRDTRGGDGEPLVVDGTLTMEPWNSRGDAAAPPPATLHLRARALPVCNGFEADLTVNPFVLAPTAEGRLRGEFDPTALPRVLPGLASRLQGTTSRAGFAATLHSRLLLRRRDPREYDLARTFGGEFAIEHLELRDETTQQVLAAIPAIDVVARAVNLRSQDVLLRSIDVDDPVVTITRTREGLELLGLRLLAATAPPAPAQARSPTPPAPTAAPEFAVDDLQVGGLDLSLRDLTTEPPTLVPISGDLGLLHFSTRAFTEPLPFSFTASLRGGNVTLPRRVVHSSMFAGLVGSTVDVVGLRGGADLEERPLLEEFELSGHLQPFPHWKGRMRAGVSTFELTALRGLAARSGVVIGDGVFDHSLTVDLRGLDGIDVHSNTVFTWLSLSEPPGGPISSYLRLPAPTNSVLFLLRNDADEHRLPIDLHIPAGGLAAGTVRDEIAEAFVRILASAVGGAAGRATSMLTGVFGLTGPPAPAFHVAVPFAAGISAPASLDLHRVVDAVGGDEQLEVVLTHELATADLGRAEQLATPPPAVVSEQARELGRRRAELAAARGPLATQLAALYATGRTHEARVAQAELLAHDTVLGDVERTLDLVLEMLASDTVRAARRRTGAAAKALGAARIQEIEAALRLALPDLAADRIVRRPPRAVATANLPTGGQVVITVRRQASR